MDKSVILGRLQQLTGTLTVAPGTAASELTALQQSLAEQLVADPAFTVSGNWLAHETVSAETAAELSMRFSHLSDVLSQPVAESAVPAPLVFRRQTSFSSNLLGNSVPQWAAGMAPTKSFGPFLDEHGLRVWFDFFFPTRLVQVCLQGSSAPLLLIPMWGALLAQKSYRIQAGSAWVASDLIAKVSALSGYYTGLRIRGGSLDLSNTAITSSGKIVIPSGASAALHLDLDQNSVTSTAVDAGVDAKETMVRMPQTFDLHFPSSVSFGAQGNASCTVFGCEIDFEFSNAAPIWISAIGQILVPAVVRSAGENPDSFQILQSKSHLCKVSGSAKFDIASGWLLPAAKIDPQQLGQAAGTGALCISLANGISAEWVGLSRAKTSLVRPAILVESGLVTVVDFFASNVYGRQKWIVWRNAASKHHSEITLTFGAAFPFIFVISAMNGEAIFCFCGHKASFDRPVDANGSPFRIESTIALAGILQTGTDFQALLLDNDLLFDGKPNQAGAFELNSLVLRNAFFSVSRPYSLFLTGKLEEGNKITKGVVVLMFGVYRYLPSLPDPYVASYLAGIRELSDRGFGQLNIALAGFVKWPNPAEVPLADAEQPDDPAYVYFRLAPLEQSAVVGTLAAGPQEGQSQFLGQTVAVEQAPRNFQTGIRTFNTALNASTIVSLAANGAFTQIPGLVAEAGPAAFQPSIQSSDISAAVVSLEANPLFNHIEDKALLVNQTLDAATNNAQSVAQSRAFFAATGIADTPTTGPSPFSYNRGGLFGPDLFMLLDVSSNADQMGVSLGNSFLIERDSFGDSTLRTVRAVPAGTTATSELQLQVLNMDVVVSAQYLRAITLPQISWEPILNIPLAIEGGPDPADLITVVPGLVVYDNDGIPTRIASESPYQIPISPLPVTKHFLKEFNDPHVPRQMSSTFTLPFALVGEANFTRTTKGPPASGCGIQFNQPYFPQLRGGLQIKAQAPAVNSTRKRPAFNGWTIQVDNNFKWGLFGIPLTGSTLGNTVKKIFNQEFSFGGNKPKVPLEQMEVSGYGASIFSNWLDEDAAIAEVSQATFDVLVGRTAREIVQVRSILYPFGVHVVRTITLTRSSNGYVFRSDSGWKAESDGFYDFRYNINFDTGTTIPVANNPYVVHGQPVKGVSNVREIKDNPDAGTFTSSFKLNDPGLPPEVLGLSLAQLQQLFKNVGSNSDTLPVEMQAVVFDADVHLDGVISGGAKDPIYGDFTVQSRKMLGYVQLAPSAILVPDHIFADLLNFQNGSLGGPVDCILDVANSKQSMRISRVDVNPALDAGGKVIFATAARGSLILPKDGSWSVVKQQIDTGDVKPVEEGQSVPIIKANNDPNFRIANPADVVVPTTSKVNFGVLQSTGTQKLLFNIPQFSPGQAKLKSDETYFADAYKLLNSKSVFPNIANALQLTNAETEVEIVEEGLMKMAERTIDLGALLPANYEYSFINEPNILRIYAQYKSTAGANGALKLGIDSTASLADRWKAALSSIRVVVDLGPFKELMWVDGNFDASSAVDPKYDIPHLQFGPVLQPVIDILQVLATLTGNDFDKGMDVGMSNAPDNWEYKFNCSKEIPVIQFPSPDELAIDPTPPLKLEAGLKVGFCFNEVLSIPTDLKQLVPACGAFVDFHGGLHVMCLSLQVASVYAVGQVDLGIAADTKAGISLHMKFGFGVELVVGLPVVANVSVLYMVEVDVGISSTALDVGAMMLFRGSADICDGLVSICIQIEAGGSIHRDLAKSETDCIAQVTFSINVTVLWVIDIHESDHWQESRQIA